MGRKKYIEGYTESITGCVWALLGLPMLLIKLLSGIGKKK